jgi:hypothetical protein
MTDSLRFETVPVLYEIHRVKSFSNCQVMKTLATEKYAARIQNFTNII